MVRQLVALDRRREPRRPLAAGRNSGEHRCLALRPRPSARNRSGAEPRKFRPDDEAAQQSRVFCRRAKQDGSADVGSHSMGLGESEFLNDRTKNSPIAEGVSRSFLRCDWPNPGRSMATKMGLACEPGPHLLESEQAHRPRRSDVADVIARFWIRVAGELFTSADVAPARSQAILWPSTFRDRQSQRRNDLLYTLRDGRVLVRFVEEFGLSEPHAVGPTSALPSCFARRQNTLDCCAASSSERNFRGSAPDRFRAETRSKRHSIDVPGVFDPRQAVRRGSRFVERLRAAGPCSRLFERVRRGSFRRIHAIRSLLPHGVAEASQCFRQSKRPCRSSRESGMWASFRLTVTICIPLPFSKHDQGRYQPFRLGGCRLTSTQP